MLLGMLQQTDGRRRGGGGLLGGTCLSLGATMNVSIARMQAQMANQYIVDVRVVLYRLKHSHVPSTTMVISPPQQPFDVLDLFRAPSGAAPHLSRCLLRRTLSGFVKLVRSRLVPTPVPAARCTEPCLGQTFVGIFPTTKNNRPDARSF